MSLISIYPAPLSFVLGAVLAPQILVRRQGADVSVAEPQELIGEGMGPGFATFLVRSERQLVQPRSVSLTRIFPCVGSLDSAVLDAPRVNVEPVGRQFLDYCIVVGYCKKYTL